MTQGEGAGMTHYILALSPLMGESRSEGDLLYWIPSRIIPYQVRDKRTGQACRTGLGGWNDKCGRGIEG